MHTSLPHPFAWVRPNVVRCDLGVRVRCDLGVRVRCDLGVRVRCDLGVRVRYDLGVRERLAQAVWPRGTWDTAHGIRLNPPAASIGSVRPPIRAVIAQSKPHQMCATSCGLRMRTCEFYTGSSVDRLSGVQLGPPGLLTGATPSPSPGLRMPLSVLTLVFVFQTSVPGPKSSHLGPRPLCPVSGSNGPPSRPHRR